MSGLQTLNPITEIVAWWWLMLGLTYLLNGRFWVAMVDECRTRPESFVPMMMVLLVISLAVVILHPLWELSPALIVTLFGWLLLIKTVAYLFIPNIADYWPDWSTQALLRWIRCRPDNGVFKWLGIGMAVWLRRV